MTDSVPERLGKYKIIEEVGRGGFAAVYKAVDTALERTVALKVLAPHLLWDPTCPHDWRHTDYDDGYARTSPVGSYPVGASPYGALDMPGNVWEWVADWYEAYPGSSFQSRYYGGQYRVIRGGAWYPYLWSVRCAGRYGLGPWHGAADIGSRCVR